MTRTILDFCLILGGAILIGLHFESIHLYIAVMSVAIGMREWRR